MDAFDEFFNCLDKFDMIIQEVQEYETHRVAEELNEMPVEEIQEFLLDGNADYLTRSDMLFMREFLWCCERDDVEVSDRMSDAKEYISLRDVNSIAADISKEERHKSKKHRGGTPDARGTRK